MAEIEGETRAYRLVADPTPSGPTFTPAAHRILDAANRCNAIDGLLDEFASKWSAHLHPRAAVADPSGTVSLSFEGTGAALADLGTNATTLASEVLHHARTALDYIAHHAAWSDSGSRNHGTQFPLAGTQTEWNKMSRGRWMRGVSDEHLRWVEEVQPFRVVEWSSNLKRLSNQDKHRVAVDIWPTYTVEFPMSSRTVDPLGNPEFVGFKVSKRQIGLLIGNGFAPGDGQEDREALPLLWDIVKGVAGVANKFLVAEGQAVIEITGNEGIGD